MTEGDRRSLDADIRDIKTRIRIERRKWRGATDMPEEAELKLQALESELEDLERQRAEVLETLGQSGTQAERIKNLITTVTWLGTRLNEIEKEVAEIRDAQDDWIAEERASRQREAVQRRQDTRAIIITVVVMMVFFAIVDVLLRVVLTR